MRASIVLATATLLGAAAADEVFVDRGACPGEGCTYRERWVVREPTDLHASPSESSDVINTLRPQEQVETVTGEVHTRPGRFIVSKAHGSFQPGDEVLLYTYLGEGWYRVQHKGALFKADLGFSPWDRKCRSDDDSRCWGVLERDVQFCWWVKVRKSSGIEGWVLDSKAFEKRGPP